MQSKLIEDERQWENEFGILPADSERSSKSTMSSSRPGAKQLNLTEFSGYIGEPSRDTGASNMSMGNFFSNRCEDVRQMIPTLSPQKLLKPIGLIGSDESG